MNRNLRVFAGAVLAAALALPLAAQESAAPVTTVVTAISKSGDAPPLPQQQVKLTVNGKDTQPTSWHPYGQGAVELVILIDNSARTSLGRNLDDITKFVQTLPPNVTAGVAYMQNGAAEFAGPMTSDHAALARQVHLPGGSPGSNASPYFCLSDLAKRWPEARSAARREVVMITDGVDEYNRRFDPEDPYVKTAIGDAQRAGLVVYSIYFRDQGRASGSGYETNAGQSLLAQLADETGGNLYYEGLANPVSMSPFFADLTRRLNNQYELGFNAPVKKKAELVELKVKSENGAVKLKAAEHVEVGAAQ
jgi:hypothetical protein